MDSWWWISDISDSIGGRQAAQRTGESELEQSLRNQGKNTFFSGIASCQVPILMALFCFHKRSCSILPLVIFLARPVFVVRRTLCTVGCSPNIWLLPLDVLTTQILSVILWEQIHSAENDASGFIWAWLLQVNFLEFNRNLSYKIMGMKAFHGCYYRHGQTSKTEPEGRVFSVVSK